MDRTILASLAGGALLLCACGHTHEEMHTTTVMEMPRGDLPPPPAPDVPIAAATPEPTSRPRLSQTVTLGQGSEAPYIPSAPAQAQAAPGPNVVVNNTVVVQTPPPMYYGGFGSYGGYGYRGGTGRLSDGPRGGSRGGSSMWGSTGWEGARRTAAPGQTPGIGGNWSAPPSYGPAQMK